MRSNNTSTANLVHLRLFLGSKSDSDLNAESAFLSKSILFSITLCDIVIDASKRSLDSLRVSDSYSVSLREKAEKMQYTNDSLVEPVDTERSRDLSQLDPERRLSPNSRFKSPKNFDDTQDALEKINQTLHKPKSYFRAEAKRDNNLYDKTENKLLNEAESKSEIFETLRSEMRKIEVLERKIEVPEKKIEVPERKIEVPERKFEFPESKLTAASIPPVELQQKIVTKKSNTANLEAERRPLHSEGKRKKILSDTLPDLEAHRKRMQSHFRERFSKLKQQYATQIQASSGKMVISPASVEVVNDNVQKKEYAPSMPFTQSRVDTVHPREQPIQEVSDDLISEKHSSHNISYEKENDTKADKDIKLQRANLPNTFDQYDNLSTFDDLTKKAEIYLEIELLEESYVIKYPIAIGRNANLPDDRDNTIATPLRNNSNLEGLSDLNYSLSLQGSSVMFPDLAKRKGTSPIQWSIISNRNNLIELKQPVKLEERDLNEYDKLKLATRLQTDPELNKLLNKRRFVQAEIE